MRTKEHTLHAEAGHTVRHHKRSHRPALRYGFMASLVVLGMIVACTIVFAVGLYAVGWKGPAIDRITAVAPFPVAFTDATPVTFAEYHDDMATLKTYYEKNALQQTGQQPPSESDLQKIILNRLIYDIVLGREARQFHITVTEKELQAQVDAIAVQAQTKDISAVLRQLSGLNVEQFKQKILVPYLQFTKLEKAIANDATLNGSKKQKAGEVLAKVKEGKQSFADLAKLYSDDTSAPVGGDLGFFGRGTMVPEFEDAAFALQPGQVSGVVQTKFGYHIIKVEERITDKTKGEQVHARHILIRTTTADELIQKKILAARVRIFLKGFQWNKQKGWVDTAAKSGA